MPEKITIKKIGRKDMPSKFKEGDTYKMTTVLDDKNRKMTAFGKWAENWSVGDNVEVNIKEKTWRNKDGFEEVSLNLDNPNKQAYIPRGGAGASGGSFNNPVISAYSSAAMFAVALAVSGAKKKLTLADLDKIADHIKSKFGVTDSTEKKDDVPVIDVEKEEKQKPKKKEEKDPDFDDDAEDDDEDDDEDPF